MQTGLFDELRRSIGVSEEDAANVRSLAPHGLAAIPAVVDKFYSRLLATTDAKSALGGGERQLSGLKEVLSMWLHELFEGNYGLEYYEKRRRIGHAHVRVGLPQHYMFTGMELIWQELEPRIRREVPEPDEKMRSFHKILSLDLAIMLESYKESYSEEVRRFERSAVEEKLTRAEHLAEIGQLAASLAHEIKNPLAGISGAIQIIRDAMSEDDPHQAIVTEILRQIRRLDATVKDLLQYARPTPPRATHVALDAIVRRVLTVLKEEPALQDVRIEYETSPTDTLIHADEGQIEQLLINLIINAAHASARGGLIYLQIRTTPTHVRLVVRDKGKGMTEEVREKAFEPFFTTKARGTGLGLSICRRIVELHGGEIDLSSELGRGTTVTVTLRHVSEEESGREANHAGARSDH